ncbi:MAG: 30S ribosomal protein S13 [Candidatus Micrarchaeaceae archaeon]
MVDEKSEREQRQKPQKQQGAQAINIVRIAGKDIDASYNIPRAIDAIKGMGYNLSNAIAKVANEKLSIDRHVSIGSLSEEQLHKLEELLKDPVSFGIPGFMVNHRKDPDTGKDLNFIGTDLIIRIKQDIDREIKAMTWRGYRHQFGQKVRGQRTRSTGRTGETVGVTKKKIQEALKTAAQAEKKAAAPASKATAASEQQAK